MFIILIAGSFAFSSEPIAVYLAFTSVSPAILKPCFWNSARVSIRLENVLEMVNSKIPFSFRQFAMSSISCSYLRCVPNGQNVQKETSLLDIKRGEMN